MYLEGMRMTTQWLKHVAAYLYMVINDYSVSQVQILWILHLLLNGFIYYQMSRTACWEGKEITALPTVTFNARIPG